jgi:hypothetical protein
MTQFRRIGHMRSSLGLLAYPPPYRCWLAISNDPDGTSLQAWEELHQLIWRELALPFEDSFFLCNYNLRWPDQVNVRDHPAILAAHAHDTMHTWGDYTQTPWRRFNRQDASEGLQILKRHGVVPRVWTDHANFTGNLRHRAMCKAMPVIADASGHTFENVDYTLDLIWEAGVRYIWDGELTTLIGQDRPVAHDEWYALQCQSLSRGKLYAWADRLGRPLWRRVQAGLFSYRPNANTQYFRHTFPDRRTLYCFRRYGFWSLADIDGFGEVIAPHVIDRLIAVGGTSIVYTHLGKRRADRMRDRQHVPCHTAKALRALVHRQAKGEVMLSSTSRLMDYLVLRDHAHVEDGCIDFRPDGIRFDALTACDLEGFSFGVYAREGGVKVHVDALPVSCRVEECGDRIYRITFGSVASGDNSPLSRGLAPECAVGEIRPVGVNEDRLRC